MLNFALLELPEAISLM